MGYGDSSAQSLRTLQVLFVGAPPINLQAACDSSCSRPVDIEIVTDGKTAIQRLADSSESPVDHTDPDLVLLQCDFELPDGLTVLHAIKSSPRLETVPVVVLDPDEDAEITYSTGGNAHVKTPQTVAEYTDLIDSVGQFWFEWAQYPAESLYSDT
ncbi:hypothetical protein [Halohasta salina]|uniref:hypothetical protein n=1 Tax=Halohasta salina TaxID=2961621 RepID=UPI0020A5B1DF|nr:hypothetical protein [Halohasta salina]